MTGAIVAMSVFKPDLANAKGRGYFLYHSKEDRVVPYRFAEGAQDARGRAGAKVELRIHDSGHGWRGDVYGDIRDRIGWLEKNHAKPPKHDK